MKCGYLDAAYVAEQFGNVVLDPAKDPNIVGPTGIFTDAEFTAAGTDGNEFRKTASVMKMVVDGYAGAGCITMGGYDYHGGMRQEGETKDFRAGRCMGAVLEYAARKGRPADDVRVQRRLAVEQRRDRQLRRGPRQGRVDERQPGHGVAVLPRLQPASAAARAAAHDRGPDGRAAPAARRLHARTATSCAPARPARTT